jgi:hypothetical protein
MVLRYVHAPVRESAPEPSGLAATAVVAAPRMEGAPSAPTTVAANLPIRSNGTVLMSRAVRPGGIVGGTRNTAARAPTVAAHPATGAAGAVAPRTGGTVGGWMVIPRRR